MPEVYERKCSEPVLMIGMSFHDANMYYATRFLAPDEFTYLCTGIGEFLLVSGLEFERARKESRVKNVKSLDNYGYIDRVKGTGDAEKAFIDVLAEFMKEQNVTKALVPGNFSLKYADSLRSKGFEITADDSIFEKERLIKMPEEIENMRVAQEANDRAMARAIEVLRESQPRNGILYYNDQPLTSEFLQSEIELELYKNGCDTRETIVAAGPGSSDPHYTGKGAIRPDELIVIDIYPYNKKNRYCADMTRTVVKGNPTHEMQKMYDLVLEAQEKAINAIKAGVTGKQVNDIVCDVFEKNGYGTPRTKSKTGFIHSTGHGIGLETHEPPRLSIAGTEPLKEGQVVTVEPGLYDPAVGGVRIEDMVVVTKDGCINLTKFPKFFTV